MTATCCYTHTFSACAWPIWGSVKPLLRLGTIAHVLEVIEAGAVVLPRLGCAGHLGVVAVLQVGHGGQGRRHAAAAREITFCTATLAGVCVLALGRGIRPHHLDICRYDRM
jgi:hypothetical protein